MNTRSDDTKEYLKQKVVDEHAFIDDKRMIRINRFRRASARRDEVCGVRQINQVWSTGIIRQ